MKKWHGKIEIKSNYKGEYFYTTVQANTLEEAVEKAKIEFIRKRSKPTVILNVKLEEMQ